MSMSYRMCGHCDQLLSEKTLKEHRKLYFNDANGTWIRFRGEDDHNIRCSSPLCVSLPSDSSITNPSLESPDTSNADMNSEDEAFEVQSDHEFEPGMQVMIISYNYNNYYYGSVWISRSCLSIIFCVCLFVLPYR